MRLFFMFPLLALLPGCATFEYASTSPDLDVARCIADGWKDTPGWGGVVPVSLTRVRDHYFVEAGYGTPPGGVIPPTNTSHPLNYLWAEVRASASGSATVYHRAFQARRSYLDEVVVKCQDKSR